MHISNNCSLLSTTLFYLFIDIYIYIILAQCNYILIYLEYLVNVLI